MCEMRTNADDICRNTSQYWVQRRDGVNLLVCGNHISKALRDLIGGYDQSADKDYSRLEGTVTVKMRKTIKLFGTERAVYV